MIYVLSLLAFLNVIPCVYMLSQITTQTTCQEQTGTVLSFHSISLQIPLAVFMAALRNALVAEHMVIFKPVFVP